MRKPHRSEYEPIEPMSGDYDGQPVDSVIVKATTLPNGERVAAFVPRAIRNLDGEALVSFGDLQDAALAVREAQDQLYSAVEVGRHSGLSWNAIGWALGVTGEAARQRFSDKEPRP